MEFTVRLADVNIRVVSLYDEVHELCRDYLTDGEPEFTVVTEPADIVNILNMSREHNGITFPNLVASLKTKYTDSTTEEIAKFTEEFLKQLWQEGLLVE